MSAVGTIVLSTKISGHDADGTTVVFCSLAVGLTVVAPELHSVVNRKISSAHNHFKVLISLFNCDALIRDLYYQLGTVRTSSITPNEETDITNSRR